MECSKCKWWRHTETITQVGGETYEEGTCHGALPHPDGWPIVSHDDFCRLFVRKDDCTVFQLFDCPSLELDCTRVVKQLPETPAEFPGPLPPEFPGPLPPEFPGPLPH